MEASSPSRMKLDRPTDAHPMLGSVRVVDQRRGARVSAEIGHPAPATSPVEQENIFKDEVVDYDQVRPPGGSESCEHCAVWPFEEFAYRIQVGLGTHQPDSTTVPTGHKERA